MVEHYTHCSALVGFVFKTDIREAGFGGRNKSQKPKVWQFEQWCGMEHMRFPEKSWFPSELVSVLAVLFWLFGLGRTARMKKWFLPRCLSKVVWMVFAERHRRRRRQNATIYVGGHPRQEDERQTKRHSIPG